MGLISLLAQISLVLPWTPVPITGQTFGVALVSLLWGRSRATLATSSYMALGFMGLPIFAQAKSGLVMGPTFGYLVGMVVASYWIGFLADKGWTRKLLLSWLAAISGSAIVFAFGVSVCLFLFLLESF